MRWMWIDRIVELVPRRRLVAIKCVSLAEEHLHDHFPAGDGLAACPVMPASLIMEGAAQSAGTLVGHAEGFREKVVLAKVTDATFTGDVGPGSVLTFTAELDRLGEEGSSATVVVEVSEGGRSDRREVARVGLVFSHLDQSSLGGSGLPERNFVFTEGLRTLLRASGIDEP